MDHARTRIAIGPYFTVDATAPPRSADEPWPRALAIPTGRGFGSGTHPTTQLCLLALGAHLRAGARPARALDFGAGSGILSIALARAGARVDAVEIDDDALAHARVCLVANGVADRVALSRTLPDAERYDVVVANILVGVLVAHAGELCARVADDGLLVLSGLVATDVPAVLSAFGARLPGFLHDVFTRDAWCAVRFQRR